MNFELSKSHLLFAFISRDHLQLARCQPPGHAAVVEVHEELHVLVGGDVRGVDQLAERFGGGHD